jgi:hypothetical protein
LSWLNALRKHLLLLSNDSFHTLRDAEPLALTPVIRSTQVVSGEQDTLLQDRATRGVFFSRLLPTRKNSPT